jgi:hypothetical protein
MVVSAVRTVVIGMAGQSNEIAMGLGQFAEKASAANDHRIYQIGRAPWHPDMQPVPAAQPLDNVRPRGNGHGSGMATLRYFAQRPAFLHTNSVLLGVPGARSGTSILHWTNAQPYIDTVTGLPFSPNADFMARMDAAVAQPRAAIAFIRWTHSESDVRRIASAPRYRLMLTAEDYLKQFRTLVATWRERYGVVPIIWVPSPPGWAAKYPQVADACVSVMSAMQSLIGDLPRFAIVNTGDLKDNSSVTGEARDAVHYSAQAQEHIASRTVRFAYPAALAN